MTAPARSAIPIDHLVLPVTGLIVARERLGRLGFTVAPDGIHPFGTANCCVFLADGTYLEPLAVADEKAARLAVAAGNAFVGRDRAFRDMVGNDGFSAIVLASSNAAHDHARFVAEGMSAGDMLEFSRVFADPAGHSANATFRLAFAAQPKIAESFFFACERVNAPKIDRTALERHANGAQRLRGQLVVSNAPQRAAAFIGQVAGAEAIEQRAGVLRLSLPNSRVDVMHADDLLQDFGVAAAPSGSLRLSAIVFGVDDLGVTERFLRNQDVSRMRHKGRLVVAPADGQGAAFIFEEMSP